MALGLLGFPPCDNDQAKPDTVMRFWSFTRIKTNGEERVGAERVQRGGAVNETVEFGDLVLFPHLEGPNAKGDVFSNDGGTTYWVSAQAPSVVLGPGVTIGSGAQLTQYQHFKKTDAKATLTVVVSKAFMEAIDENGGFPTALECPWHRPGGNFFDCRKVMWAWVDFHLEAFSFRTNSTFLQTGGFAELSGFGGDFRYDAYTNTGSTRSFWKSADFGFEPDVEGDGGGHAVVYLPAPITIEIPLSTIQVGDTFSVMAALKAVTSNHRQRESYLSAYLRDPQGANGLQWAYSGLQPLETPATKPLPSIPLAAAACPTGPDPEAGLLAFESATLDEPELAGDGATVVITRTGGSKGAVSALLTTADGTALAGTDYLSVSTPVLFADGESGSRALRVPIIPNSVEGPDRTVHLTLSDPLGCAALGTQTTAVLTILDDDKPVTGPGHFTISGTVSGLEGTGLVLRDVLAGEALTVAGNGPFTFSTPRLDGTGYEVRVDTQPSAPLQTCTVANGRGNVSGTNVTSIAVACTTPPAPGNLDPSFGDSGRVATTVPYTPTLLGARVGMALQSDGKILLVGGLKLLRLKTDGALDTTFGTAGVVNVVFNNGGLDTAMDIAVQADGKIVVAGTTSTFVVGSDDFALTRFNSNGTLDTTFGTSGHVTTDFFGSTDQVRRMRLQADGKILVVGFAVRPLSASSASTVFAIAGYEADGAPDLAFSLEGKTTDSPGNSFSIANGLTIQSDGKFVVAGSTAPNGAEDPDSGFVRYLGDNQVHLPGARDDTFGPLGNGTVEARMSGHDEAVDVVVLSDGTILGAIRFAEGVATGGIAFGFGLAHVPANGVPAPRVPQPVITFTTQSDNPRAMLLQADGKVVVVGQSGNLGTNPDLAIARFNESGLALDPTFGTDGKLTVDFFGGIESAEAVAQQADGKLVVGGFARSGAGNVFAAVRVAQ